MAARRDLVFARVRMLHDNAHSLTCLKADVAAKGNKPLERANKGRATYRRRNDERGCERGREQSKSWAVGAAGTLSERANDFFYATVGAPIYLSPWRKP